MTLPAATILTARLRLRPLVAEDADEMVAVLKDPRMHEFTGGQPLGLDDLRERYRRLTVGHSADGTEQWFNWIVRFSADDQAVGVMQATVTDDGSTADVAWEVGVPWHGQGIASEAAAGMIEWLVGHGVGTISACIHPDHQASARIASRVGFVATTETTDGEVVWRRLRPMETPADRGGCGSRR